MTDQGIIQLYWDRDERAIEETDLAYGKYCRTISCTILGSKEDAEECVNDTYLHTWNAIPPKKPDKLSAFLARICRNLSVDRIRKKTARKRGGSEWTAALEELEPFVPGGDDPEKTMEDAELAASLETFIRSLTERDQALFLRRYYYLQPIAEAADACGLREGAAKVALYRIREKLKAHLGKEGIAI
jgi:RNA polymerase sigma-70 factor (ECF subfamily)